jgi:4-amino-4-deoxy-L-arabinose transferase-like glycosyltransferase
VLLLFEFSRRRYGLLTAVLAAAYLMLMPRVVGHARLASLETATSLAWLAAFVPLWAWWTSDQPPNTRRCLISGLLFGILLLTKVQGILVPPLVVIWALFAFRQRAVRPLLIWGLTAAAVFFVGWPWLWLAPIDHMMTYLGRAAERPTLYVWYLGERYEDKLVPWHYPFVMLLITVPRVVLIPLLKRVAQRPADRTSWLIAASSFWPLIVFALPGTPVYDGTRLFLVIMPGLSLLAAQGTAALLQPAANSTTSRRRSLIVLLLIVLAVPPALQVASPFAISSYSLLVGQQRGAAALGMESSYWVEGWNGSFWKQVPEHSTVHIAPISHQFQLGALETLVPIIAERNIRLVPYYYDPQQQRGLILLNHRLADLPPDLRSPPDGAKVIAEVSFGGTVLTRLIDTSNATWDAPATWPPELLNVRPEPAETSAD